MSSYLLTTLIKPWNFHFTGFNGNKKIVSTIIPGNFEKGINIPSPLKRENITSTEVIACCLRAEHRNRIDEYKKPSKGNFPHKYLYEPKPTTLLHFLYRLRIKSNYKNAEVFLANAPDDIIKKFSTNLTQINIYANILFEILIAKKIGKMQLIELMNEFHSIHKNETIIKNRSQHYNNVLD